MIKMSNSLLLKEKVIETPNNIYLEEYDTVIKCGEIHLIKSDWSLQLLCEECGEEMEELQEFLLHSLKHHFSVTDNEVKSLISKLYGKKNDTNKNLYNNVTSSSRSIFLESNVDTDDLDQIYMTREKQERESNVNKRKLHSEKNKLRVSVDGTPIAENSYFPQNNLSTLVQYDVAALVKERHKNHIDFEFFNTGIEENTDESNCSFQNQQDFDLAAIEIEASEKTENHLEESNISNTETEVTVDHQVPIIIHNECEETDELKEASKCKICKKSIKHPRTAARHKQRHALEILQGKDPTKTEPKKKREHKCDICPKTFNKPYYLKIHKRRHDKVAFLTCEFCGAAFPDGTNLHTHRKRHLGIKKHKCTLCDKSFVATTELKIHMRSHTGERPYACPECGLTFKTSSSCCKHRKRHLNKQSYGCDKCDKSFANKKSLQHHQTSHTGEKSYSCTKCSVDFDSQEDFNEHMKLHSGLKTHACHVCGEEFSKKLDLCLHTKLHKKAAVIQPTNRTPS